MAHLERIGPDVCIAYLEHIIHTLGEEGSDFHEKLIELYLAAVHSKSELACLAFRCLERADLVLSQPITSRTRRIKSCWTSSKSRPPTALIACSVVCRPKIYTRFARSCSADLAGTRERSKSTSINSRTTLRQKSELCQCRCFSICS